MLRRTLAALAVSFAALVAGAAPALAVGGDDGTTTTTTRDLPGTTLEAEERDDGTTSPAPWLIGAGIAAAVSIGVGGTVLRRHQS